MLCKMCHCIDIHIGVCHCIFVFADFLSLIPNRKEIIIHIIIFDKQSVMKFNGQKRFFGKHNVFSVIHFLFKAVREQYFLCFFNVVQSNKHVHIRHKSQFGQRIQLFQMRALEEHKINAVFRKLFPDFVCFCLLTYFTGNDCTVRLFKPVVIFKILLCKGNIADSLQGIFNNKLYKQILVNILGNFRYFPRIYNSSDRFQKIFFCSNKLRHIFSCYTSVNSASNGKWSLG